MLYEDLYIFEFEKKLGFLVPYSTLPSRLIPQATRIDPKAQAANPAMPNHKLNYLSPKPYPPML